MKITKTSAINSLKIYSKRNAKLKMEHFYRVEAVQEVIERIFDQFDERVKHLRNLLPDSDTETVIQNEPVTKSQQNNSRLTKLLLKRK